MKAAVRSKYGLSDVLSIKEVATPTPSEDEVLIKVHATTVNRSDCHVLWGRPFFMRLFTGLFKPRLASTGSDFAGQIEAIGNNVKSFKVGDRVMGFGGALGCGSHAQYLLLSKTDRMVLIPEGMTYEDAAASIEGAVYAYWATLLELKAGQKAMVIGATGAIGSCYVQFLKQYGISITAVCRGEHSELVRALGAEKVIDYATDDFKKDSDRYDYVFDAVGKNSFFKCKHLLKEKGMYTSSGGAENIFLIPFTSLFGGKRVVFKATKISTGLNFVKDQIEKGKFKPIIDRKYPLEKIAEAFDYVATGQKVGNVVITMNA
jgi:NADPH:quinone reductase-like Zn-dependent oxidoreductase